MSLAPELIRMASEPYRAAGRIAYHFARGKLAGDPVFEAILSRGLLARRARILDLGCGQGLLAACLLAVNRSPQGPLNGAPQSTPNGAPNSMPMGPQGSLTGAAEPAFCGVERVGRYVERARIALGHHARFIEDDVRRADFGSADGIVILDVLHYIEYADQRSILERAHGALVRDGILLLRVGDAAGGWTFRLGKWVDQVVLLLSGRGLRRLRYRSTAEWCGLLSSVGFDSEIVPMSAGTPFANVLIIAKHR